jgi:hypothetical protein
MRCAIFVGVVLAVLAAIHFGAAMIDDNGTTSAPHTPAPSPGPTPTPTLDPYAAPPILIVLREANNVQVHAAYGRHLLMATVARAAAVSPDSRIILLHNQVFLHLFALLSFLHLLTIGSTNEPLVLLNPLLFSSAAQAARQHG